MITQREEMQNAIDRCKVDFEDRVENDNISMVGKYDIESLQMYLDQEEALKAEVKRYLELLNSINHTFDDGLYEEYQKTQAELNEMVGLK